MTTRSQYLAILLAPVWLLSLATATLAQSPLSEDLSKAGISLYNAQHPQPNVITGGQPTPEQIRAMHDAGVKHIINLRTDAEMDWDEKTLVTSLGMQYHSIPIAGATGVTLENADQLQDLLQSLGGEATVLHCASGNRVGALMAISSAARGNSIDEAIATGKQWGMTRLEDLVREKLRSDPQLCCADQTGASQ